jgi:hypothetical protein
MQTEPEIIYSPLQQTYSISDKSIEIEIYRLPDTGWTVEVVDVYGNSTVWDGEFATDQLAFDEVMKTIEEEGIDVLIGKPSQE